MTSEGSCPGTPTRHSIIRRAPGFQLWQTPDCAHGHPDDSWQGGQEYLPERPWGQRDYPTQGQLARSTSTGRGMSASQKYQHGGVSLPGAPAQGGGGGGVSWMGAPARGGSQPGAPAWGGRLAGQEHQHTGDMRLIHIVTVKMLSQGGRWEVGGWPTLGPGSRCWVRRARPSGAHRGCR